MGTTFQVESTTVKPFICGDSWRMSGFNVWYPNQNGTTVYPPFISDDGSTPCNHVYMDHFNVVNAYDFLFNTANVSWQDFSFDNFNVYAVHSAFNLSKTGDSFRFTNAHFTPTPWFSICNSMPECFAGIAAGAHVNAIFRITGPSASVGVTADVYSSEAFAWRYGYKIEANGFVQGSIVDINWDSVGTVIDATAPGAAWGLNNVLRGFEPLCAIWNGGSAPDIVTNCFDMGASSGLVLNHFSGAAGGDFFRSTGSTLSMVGGVISGIGGADPTHDHWFVKNTGASGTVHIRNVDIGYGITGSLVHGIDTTNVQDFILQNNSFRGFKDIVTGPYPVQIAMISGNTSVGDGTTAVQLTGTGSIRYSNNQWDKPPLATVSACGTGATINGTLNGGVGIGTAAGLTCTITVPLVVPLMSCQFGLGLSLPFATSQVSAGVWRLTAASGDISGTQITYRCGGDS